MRDARGDVGEDGVEVGEEVRGGVEVGRADLDGAVSMCQSVKSRS